MARFTLEEREKIKEDIITKGKQLFTVYGLKKTSIDDIVQSCDIGKGTFYRFFKSKEELYFEILEREEEFREELIKKMLQSNKSSKESFRAFLKECLKYVENNEFLKQLNERQEMDLLLRKLPKERVEEHFYKDKESGLLFIEKWQNEGKLIKENPEVIVGILRSLFILVYSKEEIGENIYPFVIDRLIDIIVDGMCI
ncbi:TetR/AcrR family transcriptional regulator [Clostridium sp. MSJ-11]|uniref:TetR/AcrR family transcriptional regulator n=1 Tax=Clostridium mobile TaxID=2841512 RepID=A0ABS6EH14_9CLOT|nr:TetR/AcrR family transcriptional regulator [Clostridium mobile]MBU5484057.1 TetR/AcrR family transcriptional regulator [Clostridium mobile]